MKFNLDPVQIMLDNSTKVSEICKPLFAYTPLKLFHYYEIRSNGDCYSFSSDYEVYRDFIDHNLLEPVIKNFPNFSCNQGFSLTDLRPDQEILVNTLHPLYTFLNKHSLCHECEYVISQRDGIDKKISIFIFYADSEKKGVNDFYLNNTTLLKCFAKYFLKGADTLLKNSLSFCPFEKKIAKNFTENIGSNELELPEFLFTLSPNKQLSKRQLEIVIWYMRGKTSEETAEILGLSKHSVDTYFERIKYKLRCQKKPQIIYELLKDGLFLEEIQNLASGLHYSD